MTKKAILELIKKRCKSIDSTGQFHELYIQGICDNVWQEFLMVMADSKNVDLSFYAKQYIVATMSGTLNNYYNALPEEIINMPRIGSGVVSIRTTGTRDYYVPVSEEDYIRIPSQEVFRQEEDIYFYVSYDTVYYGGIATATEAAAGVTMRLLIPFSKYGFDEELPLPATRQTMFIDNVVERVINTPPTNLNNKNSDQ